MQQHLSEKKPHEWDRYERVIVFDGVCNFCNAFVNLVIARDHQGLFKFGILQSDSAQRLLEDLGLSREDFETFLLLEKGQVYTKSTAALRIVKRLNGMWPLLCAFFLLPRPIRDVCYDFMARHRYRWMGKSKACRIPTSADQERFV